MQTTVWVTLILMFPAVMLGKFCGLLLLGHPEWLRRKTKPTVTVHTASGSVRGVMLQSSRDGILLTAATLLHDDGAEVAMAGETLVPRDRVLFVQTTPPK